MGSLVITNTAAGMGKTALTSGLASVFSEQKQQVVPYGLPDATRALLEDAISSSKQHISLIEGSGNPQKDLARAEKEDAMVVAVAAYDDDLNATAKIYGDRFAGAVLNRVPRYRTVAADKAKNELGAKFLGWIPEDQFFAAPKLNSVVDHLKGTYAFGAEFGDRLMVNFLIGGLILDWGPFYFGSRSDAGVIVRGDRPDVQLAALQTETVKALILTNGIEPIEYVYYEARTRDIPLVKVGESTTATVDNLATLAVDPPFDHSAKVERMATLIKDRLNLDAIMKHALEPATR